MGKTNIFTAAQDSECKVVGAVEHPGSGLIGLDAGEVAGFGKIDVAIVDDIKKTPKDSNVIIDFTTPAALASNIDFALVNKIAMVIGTTGLEDKDMNLIRQAANTIPLICAPNYSIGINLLAKLTKFAAEVLKDGFDAEIIESHHHGKKDSPSGTAMKLVNVLKEAYRTEDVVFGREGIVGERPAKQIGVHAIRGGDIVGDHTVLFAGIGERIELTHRASTRETLSRGAMRAAKYIVAKGKGLYTMDDVLGF